MVREASSTFDLFGQLQVELKCQILSFVADAPFENLRYPNSRSTLTHVLPYVSNEFRDITRNDLFWIAALQRVCKAMPALWLDAMYLLCDLPSTDHVQESPLQVINRTKTVLDTNVRDIYRRIVNEQIRFRAPVFAMRSPLCIGEPYGLHFFEHRYRILIAEVMRHQPESAKHGRSMDPSLPPPLFLHAHSTCFAPNTLAAVVQVLRCEMYPDGRADVILLPIAFVWVESIRIRPDTRHLYEATAIRLGKQPMVREGVMSSEPDYSM